jgi:A/G-specific adenine glycosylase
MSQLLSKKIIAWYQKHKRSLPWRTHRNTKDRDYKVLISEFMLQQTKVSTVIPYFNKFYKKFPNINSLAKARITSVLKLWEGLGYYRRARNLHLTSKILNKDFDSSLPADINQLKNLPGIGDYTASAIMAIAKNKSFIGIDGNAKRVLSRIFAIQQNKDFIKNIEKKIITMKVNKNCSELMQGIMEIGALLCRPKKPDCQKCPIQKYCKFSFRPNAEIIPSRKIKEKYFYAFFIEKKNQILFSYNKSFNFLKEMINLPLVEIEKNQSLTKITKTLFDKFEIKNTLLKKINYNISNFKMIITIVYLKNNLKFNNQNFFWIDKKKIKQKILSVLTKKLIEASN